MIPSSPLSFLPGTQPGSIDPAVPAIQCKSCHASESLSRPVAIHTNWSGSMMAHSARDPIFYSALAVANKYNNSSGEWCIRCHSPTGWLAGHSKVPTGQDLVGTDLDGIQCDYCHRAVDPVNPDTSAPFLIFPVPGYGNGMHVAQRFSTPRRGPYNNVLAPHETKMDSFQQKGEFCGVCHEVSNVFYAQDRINQIPYEYAPIERTYSEWKLSWFASQGKDGTCQACHMARSSGYGCSIGNAPLRDDLAKHDLTGGNTFVPDILPDIWTGLDTLALQDGKQRAIQTLQRAADVDIAAYRLHDTVIAQVRVTNLTGHKLPTGYPEGRRMWLNIVARDSANTIVFESGKYEPDSAKLVYDNQIKIYETHHGLKDSTAAKYGLTPGKSFHFSLNDTILFDNRIPPKGFINAAFQSRLAEPIGYTYADSQYWDMTTYILPTSAANVTATLLYQTANREYIEFLRNENVGNIADWNQWGEKLYNAWAARGKSLPVAMNTVNTVVVDSTTGVGQIKDPPLPQSFSLYQNYPNPFNPSTTITFTLRNAGAATLEVYDALGHIVERLLSKREQPGIYHVEFTPRNIPSGVYFYSLTIDRQRQVKKMLYLR